MRRERGSRSTADKHKKVNPCKREQAQTSFVFFFFFSLIFFHALCFFLLLIFVVSVALFTWYLQDSTEHLNIKRRKRRWGKVSLELSRCVREFFEGDVYTYKHGEFFFTKVCRLLMRMALVYIPHGYSVFPFRSSFRIFPALFFFSPPRCCYRSTFSLNKYISYSFFILWYSGLKVFHSFFVLSTHNFRID